MSLGTKILVTQRLDYTSAVDEYRLSLDVRWYRFLEACGLTPFPAAHTAADVRRQLESIDFDGFLLTGGETLAPYGGSNLVRDEMESMLLDYSAQCEVPVIGICRGMQHILHKLGVVLEMVEGHVSASQMIESKTGQITVNSYHNYGAEVDALHSSPDLNLLAWSEDGVVKAINHKSRPWWGYMWHPERLSPFSDRDILLFKEVFGAR